MNTIKTKIGFDIKPYVIQSIYLKEIFICSVQFYGQILLLLAITLSAGNWVYLKSIHHAKSSSLQLLQQEVLEHKRKYEQLSVEYEKLTSEERLNTLTTTLDMKQPTSNEIITLPQPKRA